MEVDLSRRGGVGTDGRIDGRIKGRMLGRRRAHAVRRAGILEMALMPLRHTHVGHRASSNLFAELSLSSRRATSKAPATAAPTRQSARQAKMRTIAGCGLPRRHVATRPH